MSQPTPLSILGTPARAPSPHIPPDIAGLADYERHARAHMPAHAWSHIASGADQELTLRHNRSAFDALRLVPEPLADLSGAHTRQTLLGQELVAPILLAPLAYLRLAHEQGDLAAVRAAMALQTGMIVSTLSSHSLEDIAQAARAASTELGRSAPLWFQLYFQPDRDFTRQLVQRADQAYVGMRKRLGEGNHDIPGKPLGDGADVAQDGCIPSACMRMLATGQALDGAGIAEQLDVVRAGQHLRQQRRGRSQYRGHRLSRVALAAFHGPA